MNSEKAWYWVAAGVLALGLSNSLAERQIGLVQGLPDQFQQAADEVTARVSDQAVRFLDVANRLSDRKDLGVDRAEVVLARVQSRVACMQNAVAARQAARAHAQADRVRVISIEKMRCVRKFTIPEAPTPILTVHQMPGPDTI